MLERVDLSHADPSDEGTEDWGTGQLSQALSTLATDVSRLQSLLPELAPQDR